VFYVVICYMALFYKGYFEPQSLFRDFRTGKNNNEVKVSGPYGNVRTVGLDARSPDRPGANQNAGSNTAI